MKGLEKANLYTMENTFEEMMAIYDQNQLNDAFFGNQTGEEEKIMELPELPVLITKQLKNFIQKYLGNIKQDRLRDAKHLAITLNKKISKAIKTGYIYIYI